MIFEPSAQAPDIRYFYHVCQSSSRPHVQGCTRGVVSLITVALLLASAAISVYFQVCSERLPLRFIWPNCFTSCPVTSSHDNVETIFFIVRNSGLCIRQRYIKRSEAYSLNLFRFLSTICFPARYSCRKKVGSHTGGPIFHVYDPDQLMPSVS